MHLVPAQPVRAPELADLRLIGGYRHDFDALRVAPVRIVIGVGAASDARVVGRAGTAVAERVGTEPVTFPRGHDGFVCGEYGGTGEPEAFAVVLREVLAG